MTAHTKKTIAKPAKAGLFYLSTNVLTKAIALFLSPVFTRLLSPSEYGLYSLYITWSGILGVLMSLGISGGTVYRSLGKFEDREDDFISSALGLLSLAFAVFFGAALLLGERLSAVTSLPVFVNYILIGEVFLNSAEAVIFAKNRYKYAYSEICVINLLYAVLSQGLAILLIYLTPLGALARIISSFAATAFLVAPRILKHVKPKRLFNKEIWKYLARLSLPLLPNAIAMTLIAQSDKIMIERISGNAELGKYSVAYSVGFMLTVITGALYSALQPWIMRKLNGERPDIAKPFTERVILLSTLGLLLFLLVSPELFALIAAPEYREAELAVYPLAIAGFLQFISNLLSANVIHTEKTGALSLFSAAAFLFNLISNIMLIPRYGYNAAAFTTAAAYGLLVVFQYAYLKRKRTPRIADGKSFLPLLLLIFAFPIYLIRNVIASRLILAAAVLIAALPLAIGAVRDFTRKRSAA